MKYYAYMTNNSWSYEQYLLYIMFRKMYNKSSCKRDHGDGDIIYIMNLIDEDGFNNVSVGNLLRN